MALLLDLPPELLNEILEHLKAVDNDTLINFANTCRTFNRLALRAYFAKNTTRDPEAGWFVAYLSPLETLRALKSAVFLRPLTAWVVHYHLSGKLGALFNELDGLYHWLKWVPSIGTIGLEFQSFKTDTQDSPEEGSLVNRDNFVFLLTRLINTVVEKGCMDLRLSRGHEILRDLDRAGASNDSTHSRSPSLRVVLPQRPARKSKPSLRRLVKWIKKKLQPQRTRFTQLEDSLLPTLKPNKITTCTVHSDILLDASFFASTVSLIKGSAASLKTLSFECPNTRPAIWTTLLSGSGIYLPHLSELSIGVDLLVIRDGAPFDDIANFLSRHPTLEKLRLNGVQRFQKTDSVPRLKKDTPFLPVLTDVMAHPAYISRFLHTRLENRKAFARLENVGMSTEYYSYFNGGNTSFEYPLLDDAIALLGKVCNKRGVDVPHTLTLRFMNTQDVQEWFNSHLTATAHSSGTRPPAPHPVSPITTLSTITTLVFNCAYLIELTSELCDMLPAWLALFPALEKLVFDEQTDWKIIEKSAFLTTVAKACPKMESVGMRNGNEDPISLDPYRNGVPGAIASNVDVTPFRRRRRGSTASRRSSRS